MLLNTVAKAHHTYLKLLSLNLLVESRDMVIDIVIEQRINEINVQHQEANEEYKNMGNEDMLFPIFRRDDLFAFTLDEYIEKYGKNNTLDIGGD